MAAAAIDPWEGERVTRWVRQSAGLDRQLAPVADELFAVARLSPGESVLDVGCGTGSTTRRAAAEVGSGGSVTGLDISTEMLAAAGRSTAAKASAPIDWINADAVEWSASTSAFDVVISRFGVMFFSDPVRAFANLLAATRPGGRLAVATWARRDESPLFAVPLDAALAAMGQPHTVPAGDEGPFSLHDAGALANALAPAGWTDIVTDVRCLDLPFAGDIEPEAAADVALDFGPTRLATADLNGIERTRVRAAIAEAMAGHVDDEGHVVLGGTFLLTTAAVP